MCYWDQRQRQSILVGVLHTETTSIAWSFGLRNLIVPGDIVPVAGMPYDHSRNVLAMSALQQGYQWLGFLDSDVVPPRDAFLRLIAHNKPIMSGVYFRRSPPHGVPVMQKPVGQWVTRLPSPGENPIIEVDVVGTGLVVIHRSVLEKVPHQRPGHPFFDWRVNYAGIPGHDKDNCLSEDFTFFKHVKKTLGIPTLVDTGVRALHVGLAEADYFTLRPAEVRSVT